MGFDAKKAFDFGMALLITVCIVVFFTFAKKWYDTPSERPSWLIYIVNVANPVSYKKLAGAHPFIDANVSMTVTDTSTIADCASNCTNSSDCLGFVYTSGHCEQYKTDFGKLVMLSTDGVDTHVKSTSNLPKWGYIKQPAGDDYAFDPVVANQHYGSLLASKDPKYLSNLCTTQFTTNCIGFSFDTSNAWLINSTANVITTSNVQSYLVDLIPESAFSNVTSF